ncbi:hypothetical protein V6615_16310 (plasmid) [Oscillospiraceae bacterium PP1C4]
MNKCETCADHATCEKDIGFLFDGCNADYKPMSTKAMTTFLELLRSGEYIDCDLIIGDVDMPASFVWDEDSTITEYGIEVFNDLMKAEFVRLPNGNIEILCDDYTLGERFVWAAAGYIGNTEFIKLFGE